MPKKDIDYSKTIIYRIVCKNLDVTDCYIGHTTNFTNRKYLHKSDCNNENSKSYNLKVYQFIRDNGGWDNWSIIEIEKFPCNDVNEALKRERYNIELYNAKLNMTIPTRTQKEYNKDNSKILQENRFKYYENKRESILYNKKVFYENNSKLIREKQKEKIFCECGCELTKQHLLRHQKTQKHLKLMNKSIIQ